jgi:hypothetical protein
MTDGLDIDAQIRDRLEGGSPRLCLCGCGQPTPPAVRNEPGRGYRKGEPTLYVRGHFGRRPRPLESWYAVNEDTGCWEWLGFRKNTGYGQFRHKGRTQPAHRFFYRLYVGEIPDGLHLDHLCRNRLCVNPEHLEPVTREENVRRGATARLTAETVAAIRCSHDSHAALARRYGVAKSTIADVRRGRTWREVEAAEGSSRE